MPIDDARERMTLRNAEMSAQGFRFEYDKAHLGVGDSGLPIEKTYWTHSRKFVILFWILILATFFLIMALLAR